MANNRMRMIGVDDSGRARIAFTFARHFNGAWRCYDDVFPFGKRMDEFFDECFEMGYGVALTDEYNDEPLTVVWHYNGNKTERTCRIVKTWSDSDYVDDWNYRCSECRGFIPVNERDPETGDVISAANYCPKCGAKVVSE